MSEATMATSSLKELLHLTFHEDVAEELTSKKHLQIVGTGNIFSKAYFGLMLEKLVDHKGALWVVPSENETKEMEHVHHLFSDRPMQKYVTSDKPEVIQRDVAKFFTWLYSERTEMAMVTAEFLCLRVPKKDKLEEEFLTLKHGTDVSLYGLFEQLINRGYETSEDAHLEPGTYRNVGDTLSIYPINSKHPLKIVFLGDTIEDIVSFNQETKKIEKEYKEFSIFPLKFSSFEGYLAEHIPEDLLVFTDEIEMNNLQVEGLEDATSFIQKELDDLSKRSIHVDFTAFPEDDDFRHVRYLSVLKYYNNADFLNDLKERYIREWRIVLYTKHKTEIENMCKESDIALVDSWTRFFEAAYKLKPAILVIEADSKQAMPHSFQNAESKLSILTDREIFLSKKTRKASSENTLLTFLASLKPGDYVVHAEHGIGVFAGIQQKTIDHITREYLEIHYADNDKLFLPTDQADKISKYISNEEKPPKLTRLDSAEWTTINRKVKKEAEKIAKELLELYAKRQMAKGTVYKADTADQEKFEATFPYTETPGQLKAINDVKKDMESDITMDRLVCGDVGFGKTEVAMRAAFKAAKNGKQVAVVSPITILADQHYKSFSKRMSSFGIKVEMLSRFRTAKEQTAILKQLKNGEIDIIVGTHRLLQKDIEFKNLGIVIIDEEQRFGVKQKEKLKELRCDVDILTLSATPIPRTLHMSLNKLRDITTITTPPPGRLPIITEVRKYSDKLVSDSIKQELDRGGQVYFLHNKVRTIEGVAHKLRNLVPDAKFVVVHGQMDPRELERRILAFKNKEYDVLVSSTIIENGIDLPNANTLIVNNADNFGLSQLYQLRGRVGRGRTQAYSYLLYSSRKLNIDAKKRLRAIVEASELGSGFQIAMKDLEIRGAGDILGASQHGAMNAVGVSHFIRLLNEMTEELKKKGGSTKSKKVEGGKDIAVEVPMTAYIPDWYVPEYEEKIAFYQRLSGIKSESLLKEEISELKESYGELPEEVENLRKVILIKILARRANISAVRVYNQHFGLKEANLTMNKSMKPEHIFSLLSTNPKWFIAGDRLKIPLEHLGTDWHDGLIKSLKALTKIPSKLKAAAK